MAKDAWEWRNRLLQLCDIRAVIDSQETIDWRNLMRQARTMGCRRMALLGFRLANELLEASVPREILQEARAERLGSKPFASECVRCFLEPPPLAFQQVCLATSRNRFGGMIESVTLCGYFTSRENTGTAGRCDDLFLAMDKTAGGDIRRSNRTHSEEHREFGDTGVACHEETSPRGTQIRRTPWTCCCRLVQARLSLGA